MTVARTSPRLCRWLLRSRLPPEQAGWRRALNALAASGLTGFSLAPSCRLMRTTWWSAPCEHPENPVTEVPFGSPWRTRFLRLRAGCAVPLLPGLVEVLKRNLSRFQNLAILRAGHVLFRVSSWVESIPPLGARPSDGVLADLNAGIPQQPILIAGLFAGTEHEAMPGAAPRLTIGVMLWTPCVWLLTLFRLRFRCVTVCILRSTGPCG